MNKKFSLMALFLINPILLFNLASCGGNSSVPGSSNYSITSASPKTCNCVKNTSNATSESESPSPSPSPSVEVSVSPSPSPEISVSPTVPPSDPPVSAPPKQKTNIFSNLIEKIKNIFKKKEK